MDKAPLNIMLADDDLDDCMFFREALEEIPVPTVLTVINDGEDLVKFLSDPGHELPDILYLDLNMPCKNGFQCLAEIKVNPVLNNIPVIIMSTSLDKEVANELYEQGAFHYIRKPAEFAKLKAIMSLSMQLTQETGGARVSRENFVLDIL